MSTDFCIKVSVCVSIFAVASSNIKIEGLCANILANAKSCFSPAEILFPLSFAISSTPFGREFTKSEAEAKCIALIKSSSGNDLFSFIFSLMLVANIKGSCNIVPIFSLNDLILISFIFIPSISISPF